MSINRVLISIMKEEPEIMIKVDDEPLKTYDELVGLLANFYDDKDFYLIPEEYKGQSKLSARIYETIIIKNVPTKDEKGFVETIKVEQTGGKHYGLVNIEHIINKIPISPNANPGCYENQGSITEEFFLLNFNLLKNDTFENRKKERNEFVKYFLKNYQLN